MNRYFKAVSFIVICLFSGHIDLKAATSEDQGLAGLFQPSLLYLVTNTDFNEKTLTDNNYSFEDIDKGYYIDSEKNITPLYEAFRLRKLEYINYFLGNGADVNTRHKGKTILMWACIYGWADVVDLLLKCGATVNLEEKDTGCTALDFACWRADAFRQSDYTIIELLLGHEARSFINFKNESPMFGRQYALARSIGGLPSRYKKCFNI